MVDNMQSQGDIMHKIIIFSTSLFILTSCTTSSVPIKSSLDTYLQHKNPEILLEQANNLNDEAHDLEMHGSYKEAIQQQRKALALREQALGAEHPLVARFLNYLAELLRNTDQFEEAEELYKKAIDIGKKQLGPEHPNVMVWNHNLAQLYLETGRYAEAEPLFKWTLEVGEKNLGAEDQEVATRLVNFGRLYVKMGRYADAEILYKRALRIYEKVLGTDHWFTCACLFNLAELYTASGCYIDAESCYKKALSISQHSLGAEHPRTAVKLHGLAYIYKITGRYTEAESLYKKALAIEEKTYGPSSLGTATTLDNLGTLYQTLARYTEAEPLYNQALRLREKYLGSKHPDVAVSLNNLAWFYRETGRYAEAEILYNRALNIVATTFGPKHLRTASAMNNMAILYVITGRYAEAESFYNQALDIRKKSLGTEHPETVTTTNNIAGLYQTTGRYIEAEQLYNRVLKIREKTLGPGHPDTASTINAIARLYQTTGRYAEAEVLYTKAIDISKKSFGPKHANIAGYINNLTLLYQTTGRYAEAEHLFKRALEINENALGPGHPDAAANLANLGRLYKDMDRYSEAEQLLQRALRIDEKAFGQEHPAVAAILNNLSELYQAMGRYDEAEPLAKRDIAICEKTFGPEHPFVADGLKDLAALYTSTDRYTEAEPLLKRALEIISRFNTPGLLHKIQSSYSHFLSKQGKTEAAIFFAKQAVNTIQTLRGNVATLGRETLKSYDTTVKYAYRHLARLLVEQGRLPEAERIMELLKEQEYAQYTTRCAGAEATFSGQAPLTAYEADRQQELHAASASLATLQAQSCRKSALCKIKKRTPEEEAEYRRLVQELDVASRQFLAVLDRVCASFGEEHAREADDLREAIGIQGDLTDLGPGTVAVQTIVNKDELTLMLITPRFRRAYTVAVDRGTLSARISAFRAVLMRDQAGQLHDPLPLARELYDLLVKPMQADLDACEARTILWHLDGPLRYLPLAALHDGSNYLVSRYCNTLYTSASKARLKDQPRSPWQGLGLGLTQARTIEGQHFDALSGVQAEINGVIRDAKHQNGTVPGEAYLNEDFTWDLFKDSLEEKGLFPLVHVASHFHLHPGDNTRSYLVLGDGKPLTLRQVKEQNNLFGGVDLLTLSACETAFGGDKYSDGAEVDALSILAQRQGAKAVLATLWPVADASTAQLMQSFYRLRETNHLTKGEALRQAQLSLLGQTAFNPGDQAPRSTPYSTRKNQSQSASAFTTPATTPYAHPYYWAPFILMGNWK